jgi:hypothetical protein
MMKLTSSILISIVFSSASTAAFTPYRLSYDELTTFETLDSGFLNALSTTGMVSVTGLPASAKQALVTMVASQHACLMGASNKQEQSFPDGTFRRTMATHTVAGAGGMQPLKAVTASSSEACDIFEAASVVVRQATQSAVCAFADHVNQALELKEGTPLLITAGNKARGEEPFAFPTFVDVVENGDHLEHFHSYQKVKAPSSKETSTIDLHTDQGLFLVFTPGRLSNGQLTKGFFIETADAGLQEVAFEAQDDLVFLLGDGVNQYVNDKVVGNSKLRAVPHALQLEVYDDAHVARVWYGLMVLPPSSAVHPAHGGITFGEIRQGLVEGKDDIIHMACSNNIHNDLGSSALMPRWLEESATAKTVCNFTEEVYCWHRCMNATEYDLSIETCAADGRLLQCMNPRGQVSDGEKHGDFFPACASPDAGNVTDFPTLPDYPRRDELCTEFAEMYADTTEYANTINLTGGNGALFQFSLDDGDTLKGRLAFNGIFGYLAFGFVGPDYPARNAMYQGRVIMAMRGGNYTASEGLDLTMGPQVEEFIISNETFSFRFWQTPYSEADVEGGVTTTSRGAGRQLHTTAVSPSEDGCYTALKFEVHDIAGQKFDLTGTDTFMWAANDVDTFMQYHGSSRGVFNITWSEIVPSDASKKAPSEKAPIANAPKSSGVMKLTSTAIFFAMFLGAVF